MTIRRSIGTTPAIVQSYPGSAGTPVITSTPETKQLEEALVISVVTNESSPNYDPAGTNIGMIKFKFLPDSAYRLDEELLEAYPMDANITDFPLENEIVVVGRFLNRFYYTKNLTTVGRVTANPIYGLRKDLRASEPSNARIQNYQKASINPVTRQSPQDSTYRLGNTFKDNYQIYTLRQNEGDITIQGRFGNSIRFGYNLQDNQSPNILIRAGQSLVARPTVATPYGLITEDINEDRSSIWMVTDQVVTLRYATEASPVHFKSIVDGPKELGGNQIIVNTDRLVFNAKTDRIMGFSNGGINWTTRGDYSIDVEKNSFENVLGTKSVSIAEDRFIQIGYGTERIGSDTLDIRGNQLVTINGPLGQTISIAGSQQMTIGVAQSLLIGGPQTTIIGGSYIQKVGGNSSTVVAGSRTATVRGDEILTVDGNIVMTVRGYNQFNMSNSYTIATDEDIRFYSQENAVLSGNRRTIIASPTIYLGEDGNDDQPVPLGEELRQFLEDFVDAILTSDPLVNTPTGPGFMSPRFRQRMTQLRLLIQQPKQVNRILSKRNFTM